MKIRGFEVAKGYEGKVKELPRRSTKHSAGYDISIVEDLTIPPNSLGVAPTGIKAYMAHDEVLKLYQRSSLSRKYHLIMANAVGIIDSDYYGNESNDGVIHVTLFNLSDQEVFIPKGERIAQAIFQKYLTVDNEEEIQNVRTGGFGSTDK